MTNEEITGRVRALLRDCPPAAVEPSAFWAAQFDAGLAWVEFPPGLGGLGLNSSYQWAVDDVLAVAGAPSNDTVNFVAVRMMAPVLGRHGNPTQQRRFLRPAFTGQEVWCQLFSEPGAGSDLASLSTRAERDGDSWVVNGQKVWTTMAHAADWALLLARTDPNVAKHAGLTFFLLDMKSAGVDVRPLRQITGEAEYSEVFLSDVRVPDEHRVGAVREGWTVAMTTLVSERAAAATLAGGPVSLMNRALELWRSLPPTHRTAQRRDRLMTLWTEVEVFRLTAARAQGRLRAGTAGSEASVVKLEVGRLSQRVANLWMELRGAESMLIDHYEPIRPDTFTHTGGSGATGDLTKSFLAVQSLTIAGGTTDVNKTVVGERMLGLPREPRLGPGRSWRDEQHDARRYPERTV